MGERDLVKTGITGDSAAAGRGHPATVRSIEVVKSRGHEFQMGRPSLAIVDGGGIEVYRRVQAPRSSNRDQAAAFDATTRITTGISGLDPLVNGGYFLGSTTVVAGISGVGKSVMGLVDVALQSRSTLRGWIHQPGQKSVERPTIHDSFGGNTRKTRMCESGLGIGELRSGVRIAVECEETASRQGAGRQRVIEILPCGIAIDFDRHSSLSRRREHRVPIRNHTGARTGDPAARVRQDPNGRVRDGGEHPVGLILAPS